MGSCGWLAAIAIGGAGCQWVFPFQAPNTTDSGGAACEPFSATWSSPTEMFVGVFALGAEFASPSAVTLSPAGNAAELLHFDLDPNPPNMPTIEVAIRNGMFENKATLDITQVTSHPRLWLDRMSRLHMFANGPNGYQAADATGSGNGLDFVWTYGLFELPPELVAMGVVRIAGVADFGALVLFEIEDLANRRFTYIEVARNEDGSFGQQQPIDAVNAMSPRDASLTPDGCIITFESAGELWQSVRGDQGFAMPTKIIDSPAVAERHPTLASDRNHLYYTAPVMIGGGMPHRLFERTRQ